MPVFTPAPCLEKPAPLEPGDRVTYLGHPATVVHAPDYAIRADMEAAGIPLNAPVANVRFDSNVPGHSRQFDIYVSALLRQS